MIMNQRGSLVSFLQRAFGSCLTGITSDRAMFILYGAGGDNVYKAYKHGRSYTWSCP